MTPQSFERPTCRLPISPWRRTHPVGAVAHNVQLAALRVIARTRTDWEAHAASIMAERNAMSRRPRRQR